MTEEEADALSERRRKHTEQIEFNKSIHEKVMGLCTGKRTWYTTEELTKIYFENIKEDWATRFAEMPSDEFIEYEASNRAYEDNNGDYPPSRCEKCSNGPHPQIPNYSGDVSAAMLVVQRMIEEQRYVKIQWNGRNWFCVLTRPNDPLPVIDTDGESFCMAICLSALRVREQLKD